MWPISERESHTPFLSEFEKVPIEERDTRRMVVESAATSWNLHERIRVRELAASHRLEQIRRLQMLEEQKAWKKEAGFDLIEIIAETHVQRFHAGFDSDPLHTRLYNPRWPHTSEEYKLEMDVEVEKLKLECFLGTTTIAGM